MEIIQAQKWVPLRQLKTSSRGDHRKEFLCFYAGLMKGDAKLHGCFQADPTQY